MKVKDEVKNMSHFSVVIISYNKKELLKKCINAISKSTIKPLRIIVVDDFSSDETEKMLRQEFSFVHVIRNCRNLGPTASRNRGAELVKGEYIIFLDNDVLVRPDTFERFIHFMECRAECGVVGAKIIPEDKENMRWSFGYDPNNFKESIGYFCGFLIRLFPNSKRLKTFSMRFILNYWDYNQTLEVGWVIESCFAIKKSLFNKIRGFEEKFFMYYEAQDLCLRIRQKNFKVYFSPDIKADSLESHTHQGLKRSLLLAKSKYRFYKKHYFYRRSNPILFVVGKIVNAIFHVIR